MSTHSDLMARLVAIQEAAFTCDAKPYYFHVQNQFPYWTNRLGPASYDWDSEEMIIEFRQVISRLVIGHATEGYKGEPEDNLYTYLAAYQAALADAPELTSATYTSGATYMYSRFPELDSDTGLQLFPAVGIPVVQVGIEITIAVEIRIATSEA